MHALIEARCPAIEALCRRYNVQKLEVFGSAARGDDSDPEGSDADFLVEFAPQAERSLATLLDLEDALSATLDLPVDLIERPAIEKSRNYIRRRHILESAKPLGAGSIWDGFNRQDPGR